jgi:hypothetical protein
MGTSPFGTKGNIKKRRGTVLNRQLCGKAPIYAFFMLILDKVDLQMEISILYFRVIFFSKRSFSIRIGQSIGMLELSYHF